MVMWNKECFLANCTSDSETKDVILYTFPKNRHRLTQWLAAIGITSAPPPGRFFRKLCSLHFEERYKTPLGLCSNAIPTLLLPESVPASLPLITPTPLDHNYAFRKISPPKRKSKLWCYDDGTDDDGNAKSPLRQLNGHQKLKTKSVQKSVKSARPAKIDSTSARNDSVKVSWPSTPVDAPYQVNGHENLNPMSQTSIESAGSAENYGTSTHEDPVKVSRPSTPFDYETCIFISPASVKLDNFKTPEEWYREAAPRVCRVCLRVGEHEAGMSPLLRHEIRTPLAYTIQHLLPDVQISPGDALPKQLCGACADDAARAERFVHQARRTQRRLAGLGVAAVADDVYQSSLRCGYLTATALDVGDPDDDGPFVSLRFDGEHLELETAFEECLKAAERGEEEMCMKEKNYATAQTSGKTEAFVKCEEYDEPLAEYVLEWNSADDRSLESCLTDLELPTERLERNHPDSPLATGDADRDQYPDIPLPLPVKRRRRRSHVLSTQRLCEAPKPNAPTAPRLDGNTSDYVHVDEENHFHPMLTCAYCRYQTPLKGKLRRHMQIRHDRRLAPSLRPRVTRRAQS